MGRGAWWTTGHGVAKSQTGLSAQQHHCLLLLFTNMQGIFRLRGDYPVVDMDSFQGLIPS